MEKLTTVEQTAFLHSMSKRAVRSIDLEHVAFPGGGEGELPIDEEDDVRFVVEKMQTFKVCSVPDFLTKLGFVPRPFGNPGKVYARFLAAFQLAENQGKLTHRGWKYRLAENEKRAS